MEDKVLLGHGPELLEMPQDTWKQHLTQIPQHSQARLSFMTGAHHQVRYFVVRELARKQRPIEPGQIAEELSLPLEQVRSILQDLESRLFFLVRDESGAVEWAYPVTVHPTPHRLHFSTGERLYGA